MFQQINNSENLRLSVSQFNKFIDEQFKALGNVIIEGEVTELSISTRGGVNIVLKDKNEQAIVNISGYAPRVEGINMIDIGMEVAVWGIPQLYSPYGKFSVSISKILPLGEGALTRAYEVLLNKLEQEGLFKEEKKRPLPLITTKIALITAKNSAAQIDFLKILKENRVNLDIDFYPVSVQGQYAVQEILFALKNVQYKNYDCVVLTRGGGSLEDLSAFNDESIARAVYSSKTITLVAIGHERDTSIAELAADIRASTPSQAAYYFVTNRAELLNKIELYIENIEIILQNRVSHISELTHQDVYYNQITKLLLDKKLKLHGFGNNFESKLNNKIYFMKNILSIYSLNSKNLQHKIKNYLDILNYYENLLESLNPKNVLKRGYAIIKTANNKIVSSINQLSVNQNISLELKDGRIETVVKNIYK